MKKIILTGCSKGIGKSITNNLLKNKFFVIGISRNSNNFIEKVKNDNKNFEHIEADLLDDNDLNKVLEVFDKHNLYGLINNAGVGLDGILATLPIKDIDKLISLNLRVPILLSRAMSRNIVKNKTTGRIINISSIICKNILVTSCGTCVIPCPRFKCDFVVNKRNSNFFNIIGSISFLSIRFFPL